MTTLHKFFVMFWFTGVLLLFAGSASAADHHMYSLCTVLTVVGIALMFVGMRTMTRAAVAEQAENRVLRRQLLLNYGVPEEKHERLLAALEVLR